MSFLLPGGGDVGEKERSYTLSAKEQIDIEQCESKIENIAWQRQPWQDCLPPLLHPAGFALQALQS